MTRSPPPLVRRPDQHLLLARGEQLGVDYGSCGVDGAGFGEVSKHTDGYRKVADS